MAGAQVGSARRREEVSSVLLTSILSDRLPSEYECQYQLRQLIWEQSLSVLSFIIKHPRNRCLLKAFVLAGKWDVVEHTWHWQNSIDDDELDAVSWRLVVQDMIRTCQQWETSVTAAMKAARCGDIVEFRDSVYRDQNFMDKTDSMGYDVWFWALTGGNTRIIDYLLRNVSIQRSRGRNVLHMARYAAPETVNYVLRRLDVTDLVNQRDHRNEDDQFGVYYYTTVMGDQRWKVVKTDRNRLAYRWAIGLEDLESLVSIKFEGKGEELDEKSMTNLKSAKETSCSVQPDRSSLYYAVEAGNVTLAETLLNYGADVNQRDWFGMTPLHAAAKYGDEDLVRLLYNHGADLTLLDNTNSTALEVARDNRHRYIEQFFQSVVSSSILLVLFFFSLQYDAS